jgi:ubiquinone/menaquinone biosynthesis C-methylase UbiE
LTEAEHKMLRALPPGRKVLDVGCAAGRASIALARKGHAVIGVDVAAPLIEQAREAARRAGVQARFQVCDPLVLPFAGGSFDALLLLKTYCYVPRQRARTAWLGELARVTTSAGWLFLTQYVIDDTVGSYEPIRAENRQRFPTLYQALEKGDGFALPAQGSARVTHVHYFMEADLLEELEASPFRIVDRFREGTLCFCTLQKQSQAAC